MAQKSKEHIRYDDNDDYNGYSNERLHQGQHRNKDDTTTCISLRDLCSYLSRRLFSHGSRAAATSLQSSEEERRGTSYKVLTSREETRISPSHLGKQCSYNIFALQHYDHYDRCTSCDLEDDIREEKNILAICLQYNELLMNNKYFRMQPQQEYVEQVNFLVTSSCMLQSRTANQTTYYVDFRGRTLVGKCIDNFDVNMLQELVCNSTHCYRALRILNLDGQRHRNNSSFKMDTRRLGIRDDTSCHRRQLKGQYSDKQLTWASTTACTFANSTTSYLARNTTDDRQFLRQQLHAPPWSDHRQHRPGHQPHQKQKGQRKKKRKEG